MFIMLVLCVEKQIKAARQTVIKHVSPFSKLGHYAMHGGVVFQKGLSFFWGLFCSTLTGRTLYSMEKNLQLEDTFIPFHVVLFH